MGKFQAGDRVIYPAHQEGPPGPGIIDSINQDGTFKVRFDTGVRHPDGTPLERVSMTDFAESDLKPA